MQTEAICNDALAADNEPIKFHRRLVTGRSNGTHFDLQKKQLHC